MGKGEPPRLLVRVPCDFANAIDGAGRRWITDSTNSAVNSATESFHYRRATVQLN